MCERVERGKKVLPCIWDNGFVTRTDPREGAPFRCYHVATPTASKSPSTTGPVQSPNHTDVMSLRASFQWAAYRRRWLGTFLIPHRSNRPNTMLLTAAIIR